MRRIVIATVVVVLLLGGAVTVLAASGQHSLTHQHPDGWTWWCDQSGQRCLMLPDGARAGAQSRFVLIAPASEQYDLETEVHPWTVDWISGEIVARGEFEAHQETWRYQIAQGESSRGIFAQNAEWNLALFSESWPQDINAYQELLQGGSSDGG